jgi:hypothetical protein
MAGFQLTLHGRIWVTPEGYCRFVEPNRMQVVIAIVAAILAAQKLSSVPPEQSGWGS